MNPPLGENCLSVVFESQTWNGNIWVMLSFYGNFAVRPTSEADVSIIVKAANAANMPISIRRYASKKKLQTATSETFWNINIWTLWLTVAGTATRARTSRRTRCTSTCGGWTPLSWHRWFWARGFFWEMTCNKSKQLKGRFKVTLCVRK